MPDIKDCDASEADAGDRAAALVSQASLDPRPALSATCKELQAELAALLGMPGACAAHRSAAG